MGVVGPSLRHLRRMDNVSEVKQEVLKEINVGGTKMTKWKKICLLEKDNYNFFFDEELGLISRINNINVSAIYDENNNRLRLYSTTNYRTNKKSSKHVYRVIFERITPEFFDNVYYVPKINYSYGEQIPISDVIEIKKFKMDLVLSFYLFKENRNVIRNISVSSKEELLNLFILATTEPVEYIIPTMMDLKEGNKYFYISKGLCELEKIYNYPNKENILCKLKTINGENFDVLYDDPKFVLNPTEEYVNELDSFNTNKNELYLQPIISKKIERDTLNVMWQPLEDASCYVIKLYKYINKPGKRKVYHLKDYVVDRNDHLLVISNIVLSNHIVVVCAEDRSGKIIAQSRGIDVGSTDGEPKWW